MMMDGELWRKLPNAHVICPAQLHSRNSKSLVQPTGSAPADSVTQDNRQRASISFWISFSL